MSIWGDYRSQQVQRDDSRFWTLLILFIPCFQQEYWRDMYIYIWEPSVKADNKFMNWCVYSALRDCQNLHRDRLSDWLAIGYTATTTTTTTTTTPATTTPTPGITVSFPDRFRTAQFSFLLKYENECVHGRILLLVLLLFSVLPLAPLSLQRRY